MSGYFVLFTLCTLSIIYWVRQKISKKRNLKLTLSSDEIGVVYFSSELYPYMCGHRGPRIYTLSVYGQLSDEIRNFDLCPGCFIQHIAEATIRCASCGLPIFPGDGVALYHQSSDGLDLSVATKVRDHVIGCLRRDCCPSGDFFAGHWSGKKFKEAFPGGVPAAVAAFETGQVVYVSNTNKQK